MMDASFKARARTLDMLGRQQIAGIPTAISELFKNAHDAYAQRVEVDYYREDGLFVLRDDGCGMEAAEFVDRWLTIATEASVKRKREERVGRSAKRGRPVLGKKGIGRLAIATIAPQVLVLTRARRDDGTLSDLTAAFVNWRMFECPELNLDDVRIPLRTFRGGTLPDGDDVADMIDQFENRNARVPKLVAGEEWDRIKADLAGFSVDPAKFAGWLGDPTLLNEGHGTHFYLLPASPNLAHDILGDRDSDVAPPLQKALLGFATPSFANGAPSVMRTAFRDHATDGTHDDLIAEDKFFTRREYENADHQISGEFDEYGQFKGSVSVYGETVSDHVINWSGGRGRPTACGPFRIKFAAVEGAARHSTLPPEEHAHLLRRTRTIGGLYIYRDGVRIQPYGNTDYDWLEIELRRSKSAYYYYFSYRQMFGLVEVDSNRNRKLREKAGREGFRENKAYRDLRGIVKSFLVQIAADFFRKGGVHGERFASHKRELDKIERDRRKRAAMARTKRTKFKSDLAAFFNRMETEKPLERAMQVAIEAEEQVRSASCHPSRGTASERIMEIERSAKDALGRLESRFRVSKPRVGIGRDLQKEWRDYQDGYEDLRDSIADIRESIESVVTKEAVSAGVPLNARTRMGETLQGLGMTALRDTRARARTVNAAAEEIWMGARKVTTKCVLAVDSAIRRAMAEFGRRDLAGMNDEQLVAFRSDLETQIREELDSATGTLDALRAQLDAVDVTGVSSVVDQLVALEQSNVTMQEQAAADLQLAQLGMAIEIINHEFGAAIRSVRSGVRSLKAWADVNPALQSLYQGIRGSFDHLDGYLTLFTPLYRRVYRKAVKIRGWEMHEYLENLFGQRLARHDVELVCTKSFAAASVWGYPSSFYPVFVNLVDNAIYWLSGQNQKLERRIQLDAAGSAFLISDTGPGIHARDRDDIFDIGFTRKPGGRGMGLHIARQTLREAHYDLVLGDRPDWTTTFVIEPKETKGRLAQ